MASRDKLTDDAIAAFVAAHPGWACVERRGAASPSGNPEGGFPKPVQALVRTFSFDEYAAGVAFAVRVAFAAEAKNHHPDLFIGYRRVEVAWSTHDSGGVTALDVELAQRSDALAR